MSTNVKAPPLAGPRLIAELDEARRLLTRRRGFEETRLSPRMQAGIRRVFGEDLTAEQVVDRILADVRAEGDAAIDRYTRAFDGGAPQTLEVPRADWSLALAALDPELQAALRTAAEQIAAFHRKQLRTSWIDWSEDGALGQIVRPLDRVGVYAPGGAAVYPSSLLMTAVPARVAGVGEIVVCSPPGPDGEISPLILAAAEVAGVDRVFRAGGAQAIGALAYGTATVPHVDKIFGPGNIFVVLAKQRVYGVVAIDGLPGPTETLLVADDGADPTLVAADLLAQAEHDPMASAILVTTSPALAERVQTELAAQLAALPRRDIANESLAANGLIVLAPDVPTAIDLANAYAPEHLCLLLRDPWTAVPLVRHAGGVFVGESSPEALGDYTAGPSHVMPTGGTARFASPVHLGEFVKVISLIGANRSAIGRLGPATVALAQAEGLDGHARAIARRLARIDRDDLCG
ncbi:MAG TPA: histidinol dehydrogenase [Thermomicrobiales bacterium]|nr:histidinol dehydrogenase [Thermomicrobiales bacterium]